MLHPKKKLSKKEIKEDQLLTTYAKAQTFYYDNKKYVGYTIFALVALVAIALIYVNNRKSNNEKAATAIGRVISIYDAASNDPKQYKLAIDGQPERGIKGLKDIVDSYGNSESGELARFYLANSYAALGQYDEALKQYNSFSSGSPMLTASAFAGMAKCNEAKGDEAKAGSNFERAAGATNNAALTPDYLNSAARCYGLAGEKEKALTLLKRIKKEFPTSQAARDADRYIAEFSI